MIKLYFAKVQGSLSGKVKRNAVKIVQSKQLFTIQKYQLTNIKVSKILPNQKF